MTMRKKAALIALTWTVAVILMVLPWVWSAYAHALTSRIVQDYELLLTGSVLGWTTRGVFGRRRA